MRTVKNEDCDVTGCCLGCHATIYRRHRVACVVIEAQRLRTALQDIYAEPDAARIKAGKVLARTPAGLNRLFGVSKRAIKAVRSRQNWKHV